MNDNILNSQIRRFSDSQSGQIALIILTVMAIALTLGLSLSQRVITDLEITQEEEKSAQAFSAAEGGVEEALRILDQGDDVPGDLGNQVATDLGVSSVSIQTTAVGGETQFNYPEEVAQGGNILIWLRDHDADGNFDKSSGYDENEIEVCWETNAAMEIIYFYEDSGGSYDITRYAYDPDGTRRSANNFDAPTGGCAGLTTGAEITGLTAGGETPLFLILRPFYESTNLGVIGTEAIPVQGHEVVSTGEVDRSETEVISRRVKVFRSWEVPSDFFYYSVFADTGVTTQ